MTRIAMGFISFLILTATAFANTPQAPFHLGRIWVNPEFDGAEGWNSAIQYPGGIPAMGMAGDSTEICRGWVSQGQKWGTYLFSTDWTDPEGTAWEHSASSSFRIVNNLYPVGMQEYLRFERPVISIQTVSSTTGADTSITVQMHPGSAGWDSIHTSLPDHDGVGPLPDPIIDPILVTEEVIETTWRYNQGVELNRRMYGYPYGSPHQDYVLQDITLTNNGISGNLAAAPVLTDQTLTNVVWAQAYDYRNLQAPTSLQVAHDADGTYVEPWGVGNHSAVLFSDGDDPATPGPDWGDPTTDPFYQAHMVSTAHILIGPLFVSTGSGGDYATDDLAQPAFHMMYYDHGLDVAGKPYSPPPTNIAPGGAEDQRGLLTYGTYQLPLNTNYRDFPTLAAIAIADDPTTAIMGYGPLDGGEISETNWADHGWDIPFGESVRIVQMVAAGGIDQEEARRIGSNWITRIEAGESEDSWMSEPDITIVKSGRDSAMKAAALAYWNFRGSLPDNVTPEILASWGIADLIDPKPVGYGEFDVPDAPRPPGGIYVLRTDHSMEIRWTKEAETTPDHDTGVHDIVGYRVWRQAVSRSAPWELISDGRTYDYLDIAAEGDIPAGRFFYDHMTTVAGTVYWYAVTAYDDGSQNWARPGKSLESSRWWTWTGYNHLGSLALDWAPVSVSNRENMSSRLEANTPNPFNPVTTIHFTIAETAPVKLVVYNMAGQRVRTLIDGARYAGSHNIVWDGKDAMGRNCASGVYVSRLITPGTTDVRKMMLVR
jgi:hypothetical protein